MMIKISEEYFRINKKSFLKLSLQKLCRCDTVDPLAGKLNYHATK